MPPLPVPDHAMVGRVSELADLVTRVESGTPSVVLLGGDAGVGKTRLLSELTGQAQADGALVLLGHCLDLGDSVAPYLPIGEMVARLHDEDPEQVARLARSHERLAPVLPQAVRPQVSAADAGGFFAAVQAAIEELAAQQPVLMVLEDAHWADRSTRDLLTFLLHRQLSGPVTIVISYRADDLHRRHPLRRDLAEWGRLSGVHRMSLGPLDDRDMRGLLDLLWSDEVPRQEASAADIVARAGGNPFFAEELLEASRCSSGSGVPEDLADLLLVRVDGLPDDARAVVRAASASGQTVSHGLLADVTGLAPDALDAALRAVLDAHVFSTSGSGYHFRHALLGEAAYDDLLPGERVRLHAAYAESLKDCDLPGAAAALARHARLAGQREVAVAAAISAGDEAAAASGPAAAAQLFDDALTMVIEDPSLVSPLSSYDLRLRAAGALIESGDPYRAIDLLGEIESAQLSPQDRGQLALRTAEARLLTDVPESLRPLLTEAIDEVGAEATPILAQLYAKRARAAFTDDDVEGAAADADEAVRLARALDVPDVTSDAMTTLARLDDLAGEGERSLTRLDEVIERTQRMGDTEGELRARHQRHRVLARLDRHTEARDEAVAAVRRADELGVPTSWFALDCRILAALYCVLTGEWRTADELLDVSRLGLRDSPTTAPLTALAMTLAAARGDDAAVLHQLPRVQPEWSREMMVGLHSGPAAADVLGRQGDLDGMLEVYDRLVTTVREVWQMYRFDARIRLSALVIGHLATARAQRRDDAHADRVAALLAEAEAVAEIRRDETRLGLESRAWLARVRAEQARYDWGGRGAPPRELLDRLAEAAELFEAAAFPYDQAWVLVRHAEALAASGDHAAARGAAASAREIALRLGAAPLLAVVGRRGSTPTAPTASGPTLTPREREVLALVTLGRTNGEIAKELFISTKTASVHVSNILAKLGAATRTEAATLATREGLLD